MRTEGEDETEDWQLDETEDEEDETEEGQGIGHIQTRGRHSQGSVFRPGIHWDSWASSRVDLHVHSRSDGPHDANEEEDETEEWQEEGETEERRSRASRARALRPSARSMASKPLRCAEHGINGSEGQGVEEHDILTTRLEKGKWAILTLPTVAPTDKNLHDVALATEVFKLD